MVKHFSHPIQGDSRSASIFRRQNQSGKARENPENTTAVFRKGGVTNVGYITVEKKKG